ncbi:hypothetical protein WJX81_000054 [Elliptochloris bilobata]|uniref:DUS-like FMN-binding domain-containing protein n=1 Tax=Elliptochloris bilobata TaxID=381761 RepID=A0AAW1S835_9CHLO
MPAKQQAPQLLSVAPMMDWTDIHYRQLARLITKHTFLYTEMVVDSTLIHNPDTDRFLWFPPEQRPLVLQLGGSDPAKLAAAAGIAARYGYDEINLNCGCPSDRVAGAGCFGAALMLRPDVVAGCCAAMRAAVPTRVTVKCRLGADDVDSYEALCNFVAVVSARGGVDHFIIHARKCLLTGLSPHQNRTVPPLRREWVWALKRDFPHLAFSLNGQVEGCHAAARALAAPVPGSEAGLGSHAAAGACIEGVMIGRAAYSAPWSCLADADMAVWGAPANAAASRREVLERYAVYGDSVLGRWGVRQDGSLVPGVRAVAKPLLGLFHGEPGGRRFRVALEHGLRKKPATLSALLQEALRAIPDSVLDAPPRRTQAPPFAACAEDLKGPDGAGPSAREGGPAEIRGPAPPIHAVSARRGLERGKPGLAPDDERGAPGKRPRVAVY